MGSTAHSHRLDFIIVGCILVMAVAGLIAVKMYSASSSGDTVKITGPDDMVVELPLDEDTRYVVSTELGNNTVVIQDRTVHIEDSDCKNHICMEEGTITTPGQSLICLPHKLVVQIVDSSDTSGTDSGLSGTASRYDTVSK